jgi:phosphate:Na+ symporter
VFLNGDLKCAQQLLSGTDQFRALELRYAETHLIRLADKSPQSIETSSLHLDLISDMKRINSLFCSIAYPILDEAGVLAPSRLREQIAQVVQEAEDAREVRGVREPRALPAAPTEIPAK